MRTDRHLTAALVAGLLLGIGGMGGQPVLDARPITATAPGGELTGTIDPSRTGGLTLIFESPNPNDDHVGQSSVGVPVELRRVTHVDLTTNEGWSRVSDLTVEEILALPDDAFDHSRSGISDSDGMVTFHGLPLGLYVVTPVAGADQTFDPFVITIPMVDPSGSTWRYVLTAYPKVAGADDDPSESPRPPADPTEPTDSPGPPEPGDPVDAPTTDQPGIPEGPGTLEAELPGGQHRPGGGLAATGSAVVGVFVAGIGLVVLGLVLMRRRNEAP